MRNPNRIEPFLKEIGKVWREKAPDWRFGQLMVNFLPYLQNKVGDVWFPEEDEFLLTFKQFFNGEDEEKRNRANQREQSTEGNSNKSKDSFPNDDSFEI